MQNPGVELLPAGTRADGQSVQGRCRRATESGSCTFLQQQRAGRCVQRTQRSSHEESPPPKTRDGQAQVAGQKRRWEESHRACPRRQTIAGAWAGARGMPACETRRQTDEGPWRRPHPTLRQTGKGSWERTGPPPRQAGEGPWGRTEAQSRPVCGSRRQADEGPWRSAHSSLRQAGKCPWERTSPTIRQTG